MTVCHSATPKILCLLCKPNIHLLIYKNPILTTKPPYKLTEVGNSTLTVSKMDHATAIVNPCVTVKTRYNSEHKIWYLMA